MSYQVQGYQQYQHVSAAGMTHPNELVSHTRTGPQSKANQAKQQLDGQQRTHTQQIHATIQQEERRDGDDDRTKST